MDCMGEYVLERTVIEVAYLIDEDREAERMLVLSTAVVLDFHDEDKPTLTKSRQWQVRVMVAGSIPGNGTLECSIVPQDLQKVIGSKYSASSAATFLLLQEPTTLGDSGGELFFIVLFGGFAIMHAQASLSEVTVKPGKGTLDRGLQSS